MVGGPAHWLSTLRVYVSRLRRALDLWRGPALSGFADLLFAGPMPPGWKKPGSARSRTGWWCQRPATVISVPALDRVMAGEVESLPGGAISVPYQVVVPS